MSASPLADADRTASTQADAPVDRVAMPCAHEAPPRFAIEVVTVGENGAPLAGERVELVNAAGDVSRTVTDARGAARFDGLAAGDYRLSLHELDAEAWESLGVTPLAEAAARSHGDRRFEPASRPPAVRSHTAARGECLASIAFRHGFFPATVAGFARNGDLREQRRSLYTLDPGDVVALPEKRRESVKVSTGQRCRLKRRGVPEVLRKGFLDHRHRPRAGLRYRLHVEGGSGPPVKDVEGTLDPEGFLTAFIPPDATLARIVLDPGDEEEVHRLELGYLGPVDTTRGVQARLKNLAFYDGPEDGAPGEATRAAILRFQEANGLEPTGEADAGTQEALVGQHRS